MRYGSRVAVTRASNILWTIIGLENDGDDLYYWVWELVSVVYRWQQHADQLGLVAYMQMSVEIEENEKKKNIVRENQED